ncbi:MAG: T9SS type A sorting domain-containing protein [Bacteroidota bacterium]
MKNILLLLAIVLVTETNAQLNLDWKEIGPDNTGGIIFGLVLDKRDATRQTLYAGAYGGGIWKSTNGGNNWNYIGCAGNHAVSCMTQASDGTIYFGTGGILADNGSGSSFNVAHTGNGIYKIDANDNITHLPATFAADITSHWTVVNRIACHPTDTNKLIAATGKGLYRSVNGGTTWDSIVVSGISNGQSAIDVKWSPDGMNVFAAVGGNNKLVRSLDGGNNWSKVTTGFPPTQGRIEIAIAPSNSGVVYVSIATTSGYLYGVYRTTDTTNTWSRIAQGGNSFGFAWWFSNALAVSQTNPDIIFGGSVEPYTWSTLGGLKLSQQFMDPQFSPTDFVDQFLYVINDLNPDEMYAATTRGVFKSTNAVSAFPFPTFNSKNSGIKARDFYSVAASRSGRVMGSSNFNGTYITDNTSQSFTRLNRDVAFCEFSHLNPNFLFTESYYGELNMSGNNGNTFWSALDFNIDPQGYGQPSRCGGQQSSSAQFINPFILHETKTAYSTNDSVVFVASTSYSAGDTVTGVSATANTSFQYILPVNLSSGDSLNIPDPVKSRLLLSSYCGVWMKRHALSMVINPDWYKITNAIPGSAQSMAVTKDGNTIYIGTSFGRVYKVSGLNTATFSGFVVDSLPQTFSIVSSNRIEGIAVDPTNENIVIATVAGNSNLPNFYKSINGGQSWAPIQIGSAGTSAYTCVIDANNSNNYLVGTERGIWTSNNAGASWQQDNQNLCDVPVYRLRQFPLLQDDCQVVYAATNSRGLWRTFTLTPSGCNTSVGINDDYAPTTASGFKLFPNPSYNMVNVEMDLEQSQQVKLSVADITGRIVFTEEQYLQAGKQHVPVDISSLQSGTYIVHAGFNGTQKSSLLIKAE